MEKIIALPEEAEEARTRLPIVPIVIRNADDVAGRDSLTVHPALVDIAVLPPIDVSAWTRAELSQRIEEVRDSYLDLLADWPEDDDDPRLVPGGQR